LQARKAIFRRGWEKLILDLKKREEGLLLPSERKGGKVPGKDQTRRLLRKKKEGSIAPRGREGKGGRRRVFQAITERGEGNMVLFQLPRNRGRGEIGRRVAVLLLVVD